ncbi:ABC transporter permease [Nocardioides sp. NPDC087217]|uniref:ABC transporter permease n=1 Tax=Nocardioides sp. NPDC087217 TaxID=3364335 RepID=UPI0037FECE64
MLVVLWTSIQPDVYPTLPPDGFSLRWWRQALTDEWLVPMALSAQIAFIAAAIAVVMGTAAAYSLARSTGRGRGVLEAFLATPLLVPEIIISLSVVQVVSMADVRFLLGPVMLIATHAVIGVPFVLRTVGVSLVTIDPAWEKAAQDLGASRARTFVTITLPLMSSGIFAGALFAFIQSFNNVELSLFLTSASASTLPIQILTYMESQYSPTLASVATTSVIGLCLITAIASRFARLSDFIQGGRQ